MVQILLRAFLFCVIEFLGILSLCISISVKIKESKVNIQKIIKLTYPSHKNQWLKSTGDSVKTDSYTKWGT